ncbi:M23 family metallopeptidase [Methylopila sp. Yamaguchi]|uniref:M23 family metallopeptidase n=1 Tax=Methylopila sp. Yamaguchi TaxID=1437817 RepID=UPI000CA679E1|nr:M23 family metallopeptidase [Methylopila sp. Yamaguchi]GBD50893.1 peptidase M23/M37 [Methylopila sp. Yamaguchi]
MTIDRPLPSGGDLIVIECGRRIAIRLPRYGAAAVAAMIALSFGWSLGTAYYVAFHDVVVAEIRGGAKAAASAYEAQIDQLKTELERVRTRRLVEKTGSEQRLAELARRQESLERRQTVLAELAGPALDRSEAPTSYATKPTPLDRLEGERRGLAASTEPANPAEQISSGLDKLEAGQGAALDALETRIDDKRRKLQRIYDGLALPKSNGRGAEAGRGGPFEPLPARAQTFEARADRVAAQRAVTAELRDRLEDAPIRTPAPGASISSGFGARTDPFLGQPAFHAGLDFESALGRPIRATAPGRVTAAGYSGGYGLMVEIDHGGGLTTRFGHMSSAAVQLGQTVKAGAVLGHVGSTGRSTGPHLHYETRIDGEAVDPLRFLRAGAAYAATLSD